MYLLPIANDIALTVKFKCNLETNETTCIIEDSTKEFGEKQYLLNQNETSIDAVKWYLEDIGMLTKVRSKTMHYSRIDNGHINNTIVYTFV